MIYVFFLFICFRLEAMQIKVTIYKTHYQQILAYKSFPKILLTIVKTKIS